MLRIINWYKTRDGREEEKNPFYSQIKGKDNSNFYQRKILIVKISPSNAFFSYYAAYV